MCVHKNVHAQRDYLLFKVTQPCTHASGKGQQLGKSEVYHLLLLPKA